MIIYGLNVHLIYLLNCYFTCKIIAPKDSSIWIQRNSLTTGVGNIIVTFVKIQIIPKVKSNIAQNPSRVLFKYMIKEKNTIFLWCNEKLILCHKGIFFETQMASIVFYENTIDNSNLLMKRLQFHTKWINILAFGSIELIFSQVLS